MAAMNSKKHLGCFAFREMCGPWATRLYINLSRGSHLLHYEVVTVCGKRKKHKMHITVARRWDSPDRREAFFQCI